MLEDRASSAHRAPEFDFDIYKDARLQADLHDGFKSLHAAAPDIFWTRATAAIGWSLAMI